MTKKRGLHPDKALSALKVRQVTKAGRYSDGNGLYLVVSDTGAKRWMLRLVVHGRRRDMGLGGAGLVSLADARQLALQYRAIARNGGDPVEERRKERTTVPTFAEAARQVHADAESTWKNPKHAQQWINTLETYAVPHIGNMQLDHIRSADVLRVLSPIWLEKPETARRVRQRLKTVFDWAKAAGFRTTDNPVDGIERGLPKQTAKQQHHAAMPLAEVPAFVQRLQRTDESGLIGRRAFELLILTATRTSEVLKAEWSEFDLKEGLWTISAERMKMDREHRIPLPQRAIDIVEEMQALGLQGNYVFPGTKLDSPMSNMAFTMTLRRMEVPYTAHGFRSSFRDWVAETTDYSNEMAEMALAHAVGNKVEAAYRRGDMLDRRRAMMEDWATFLA
ncbi:integrase arm-type DNA-binding domain-containing protein [Sulfitobacter pseudonitzschiae]|uniref:Integrase arm-type DNA-binding domain-containing protein n=2 Tax=Pseudosulfitobacter pseudonitzschiae TaxID=1402135 RepID=A0A9Q2NQD4_9RHOB|nr:integrase arm-type DNA-binding domain-containing protein [Pseudosulfitobacter pseudonitzschiae]MBM2357047.1 integrase arm-type DNA-binding domain-containing protein [Pseudosulfitobacter pseudonitzschiae]MBM2385821.1 integrase arm-type DNA-binding domain-containing protein [Pseudosulfitobacter pseudonitzschiae]MBM2405234.1 integrase arm-type DNA-binding domain-containing protein [Pseudosulfitobacter pseudonitzschiae]QRD52995.1 integrase arm-type DNA-binding domain-containing protein [Pseudosu